MISEKNTACGGAPGYHKVDDTAVVLDCCVPGAAVCEHRLMTRSHKPSEHMSIRENGDVASGPRARWTDCVQRGCSGGGAPGYHEVDVTATAVVM